MQEPIDSGLYSDDITDVEIIKDDTSYSQVQPTAVYIDPKTGQSIDTTKLEPFEIIKLIASELDIAINDPKKGCKKCYGRGYTSIITKNQQPIPCICVYKQKNNQDHQMMTSPNRVTRRKNKI